MLGVTLEELDREGYESRLRELLLSYGSLVVTPNPEMLVAATRDGHLRVVLSQAALRLVDGFGVVLLGRLQGKRHTRFSGADALDFLASEASTNGLRLFLLGGLHEGDATRAASVLLERYPSLSVCGMSGGDSARVLLEPIVSFAPDILAVAFGHGKQEIWLADHLASLPSVRIGIGVGGAIEMLAGRQHRAPTWIRVLGLEWLVRLVRQPRRWKRIWTAVVIFPILAIRDTLRL